MGGWSDTGGLLPAGQSAPDGFADERVCVRWLTVNDLVRDYDAVMASREDIRGVFGPGSDWPGDDLTLEQDLIDLGWHQKEFQRGTSFAYTVMTPDESRCIGCLYLYPPRDRAFDAEVILWARSGEAGLDEHLQRAVRDWLAREWPFRRVAWPGRELSWEEYLGG